MVLLQFLNESPLSLALEFTAYFQVMGSRIKSPLGLEGADALLPNTYVLAECHRSRALNDPNLGKHVGKCSDRRPVRIGEVMQSPSFPRASTCTLQQPGKKSPEFGHPLQTSAQSQNGLKPQMAPLPATRNVDPTGKPRKDVSVPL